MLGLARSFFEQRNILEVDCPIITQAASIDAHIDLIPTLHGDKRRYLHSSPEYAMKRLITEGLGDIYQLGHVFRQGEIGLKHNPEFTMAEWYRLSFTFDKMIFETLDFVQLFLGNLPTQMLSYHEAFLKYTGLDCMQSPIADLEQYLREKGHYIYASALNEGRDALLNLILGLEIEPQLGLDGLVALAYYPSSQAALAQTVERPEGLVAERFEVYYKGIELANGYHELANAEEQRMRFSAANKERELLGKESLPIDELFLEALAIGLPDCCGVAVGFDRLMMLRQKTTNICDVLPFSWKDS